jgi:aerotaxis receptor
LKQADEKKSMRSITGKEILISQDDEIVSSSNLRGDIVFCNDTFERISGYTHDELINQPHSILRHPDMPKQAFGMLWSALKAGNPWMGIVKNRCKNGDHYWVNAYITPLKENGNIHGYESVRIKPNKEIVERAEKVYQRLNNGLAPIPTSEKLWCDYGSFFIIGLFSWICMLVALYFLQSNSLGSSIQSAILSCIFSFAVYFYEQKKLQQAIVEAKKIIDDPFAAYIYTGRSDAMGEIELAQIAIKARLGTALGRFGEAAKELQKNRILHINTRNKPMQE